MTTTERVQSRIPTFRWLPLAVIGGLTVLFPLVVVVGYYL